MPTRGPELEMPDIDELDSSFKRRLALAVALIALFGAIAGYAASDAGVRAAKTVRDAQRASVMALAAQDTAWAQFEESISNYVEVSTVKRRHDIEEVQAQLLGSTPLSSDAQYWAQAAQKLTDLSTLRQPGRDADRLDLLSKLFEAPNRATLRQQADQQTASAWGNKVNLYLGVITLLAVALTLLGLSLTVGVDVRRFLVWPAGLIVAGGLAGFLVILISPTPQTSEAAIAAVVEGDRLFAVRDFDLALRAYSRAVDLDPSYTTAYQRRGTAHLVAGSPERENWFVLSTTSKDARQAGVADLNKALDLGGEDYATLVNQGANYFHLADYARCEELSRRAIALNPTLPLPWLNLGLALVAQGRENDAADIYQRAIGLIEQRPYPQERLELYAGARGPLEKLLGLRPDLEAQVRRFQGELVQAQGRALLPDARSANGVSVSAMTATASGFILRTDVQYSNLPSNSRLAWIVYYRPPGPGRDWAQCSDLSILEQTQLPLSGSAFKPLADTRCLTAGDYRIDLYADAQLLASVTASPSAAPLKLTPYIDPLFALSLCRPENWTFSADLTGTAELTSPDKLHQLSIRVVPLPAKVSEANHQTVVTETLNRLANSFSPDARTTQQNATVRIGFVVGSDRLLMLPDTTSAYVWACLGPDNVLRTVTARYPAAGSPDLADLVSRIYLPSPQSEN